MSNITNATDVEMGHEQIAGLIKAGETDAAMFDRDTIIKMNCVTECIYYLDKYLLDCLICSPTQTVHAYQKLSTGPGIVTDRGRRSSGQVEDIFEVPPAVNDWSSSSMMTVVCWNFGPALYCI